MPKFGSTKRRKVSDLSLEDLADQVRDRVLVSDSIEADHIQQSAFSALQSKAKVSSMNIENGAVDESKLSLALEQKINSARQLAERAIGAAVFRFQQEIGDLEGAFAARIERAASLASSAIQPGVRAFLHSLKIRTVEFGFTAIAADTSITSTQATFYNVATGSGDVTITLPSATTCQGLMLGFHKTLAANNMILDGAASQTINGSTTKSYGSQYDAVIIISNGSNWNIISGS